MASTAIACSRRCSRCTSATSLEEMFVRFHQLCAEVDFHPRNHYQPSVSSMLAQAGAGDD